MLARPLHHNCAVAEVERLQKAVSTESRRRQDLAVQYDIVNDERMALRAEVERLRAERDAERGQHHRLQQIVTGMLDPTDGSAVIEQLQAALERSRALLSEAEDELWHHAAISSDPDTRDLWSRIRSFLASVDTKEGR